MKILIGGASGLIGSELVQALATKGHHVIRLVRDKRLVGEDSIFWDPERGVLDPHALAGIDAAINLSGENVAARRWSVAQKQKIEQSRLDATTTMAQAIALLSDPPQVFISASAIGFYGDRGNDICTEEMSCGEGFLASVCKRWEQAALPAVERGIRTVFLRTGVVLTPKGGALAKMVPAFKLGLGGKLGSGNQYMSWIAIDDVIASILFILENTKVEGPVNLVAPDPVTNGELTTLLGKALHRPAYLPAPAFVLRLLLGKEMADEFLLSSIRAVPRKLQGMGFIFKYPELEQAMRTWYGRKEDSKER